MSRPVSGRTPAPLHLRWIVPALAGLVFLALATSIASGHSFAFDRSLILLLREPGNPAVPLGPAWFQEAVRDMTAFGSFVGLFFMARGGRGDPRRSNKAMRLRVMLQGAALVLFVLAILTKG